MPNTDLQLYTRSDLDAAQRRGRVSGWLQGAGAVVLLGVAMNLLGWIPMVAVLGVGAYVVYRVVAK